MNTTVESVKTMHPEEFLHYGGHLPVKYESSAFGMVTFSSEPHKHTGRVFKVIVELDYFSIAKNDTRYINWFNVSNGIDYSCYGEIYKDSNLVATTRISQ